MAAGAAQDSEVIQRIGPVRVSVRQLRYVARTLYLVALVAAAGQALTMEDEIKRRVAALPDLERGVQPLATSFATYTLMMVNVVNVVVLSLFLGLVLRWVLRGPMEAGRALWVPWVAKIGFSVVFLAYVAVVAW